MADAFPKWARARGPETDANVQAIIAFEQMLTALEFYADPDTYFAIAIMPDPPCGAFIHDYSIHGDPDYATDDEWPGKRAREALRAWIQAVRPSED